MKHKPVDPYCFPGTNILRNLPGILDRTELEAYESLQAAINLDVLFKHPASVTDLNYLKSIHRTLFGEVYPWAGETRRDLGHMTKTRANGSVVTYSNSAFVDPELTRMFALLAAENCLKGLSIDRFALRAAYFYGELDAIHAFREGNSRTLSAPSSTPSHTTPVFAPTGLPTPPPKPPATTSIAPATEPSCRATPHLSPPSSPPHSLRSDPPSRYTQRCTRALSVVTQEWSHPPAP